MKWIKKKKVEVNKEDKPFKIGKTYKFESLNTKIENTKLKNNTAKCIELYETFGLFQFKNYKECFLYNASEFLITEV